jgi:hypothetical protein
MKRAATAQRTLIESSQIKKKYLPEKNLCQRARPAGEDPQLKLAL